MQVGFIGLGSQGAPMARRIIEGGFGTILWARRPATLEPFADTPAEIAQMHEQAHHVCFIASSVNFPVHCRP